MNINWNFLLLFTHFSLLMSQTLQLNSCMPTLTLSFFNSHCNISPLVDISPKEVQSTRPTLNSRARINECGVPETPIAWYRGTWHTTKWSLLWPGGHVAHSFYPLLESEWNPEPSRAWQVFKWRQVRVRGKRCFNFGFSTLVIITRVGFFKFSAAPEWRGDNY